MKGSSPLFPPSSFFASKNFSYINMYTNVYFTAIEKCSKYNGFDSQYKNDISNNFGTKSKLILKGKYFLPKKIQFNFNFLLHLLQWNKIPSYFSFGSRSILLNGMSYCFAFIKILKAATNLYYWNTITAVFMTLGDTLKFLHCLTN